MHVISSSSGWQPRLQVGESLPTIRKDSPPSFAKELKTGIESVDHSQHQAEQAMQNGALNGAENIHETMIQLEEADISLRLLMKIRNKALESYQEIMRMQF
jgi:flagellar hook-basal body complex protein FliE